jgi:hypothetical protein
MNTGVYDKQNDRFYPCESTHHWETIETILNDVYNINIYNPTLNQDAISKMETFILTNFKLQGAKVNVTNYLDEASEIRNDYY